MEPILLHVHIQGFSESESESERFAYEQMS